MNLGLGLRRALTSLILPVAVSLLTIPAIQKTSSSFFFEVTLTSSTPGIVQLFYDPTGGDNVREENSARFQLNVADTVVTHRFPLPEGRYQGFRFDPIDRQGTVAFSGARIVRVDPWRTQAEIVTAIPAARFIAVHHVRSLNVLGDETQLVTTESANDPILTVSLKTPLLLKQSASRARLALARAVGQSVVVIWVFFWLLGRLATRAHPALSRGWQHTVDWAGRHQTAAIAATAIVAAVLSCYPVVFFGKSFFSPDNGTQLLYAKFPTLPGYTTTILEDARGADLGAPMWEFLPYSVVESRAILRDHELPLWNRFNSSGVTLVGQGLSMLGDPLQLGVILAGGTSWAWDVKFVTAKTLFALGLGLTVLACTGHLPAAMVLTVSSAFIGFFAFRFSHPAFFSVAYAPWILYCWVRFVQVGSDKTSSQVRWLSGLVAANWTVMNSGTVKEAYMLVVFLNLTGLLALLIQKDNGRLKWQKVFRMLLAQVVFVMISAPVWVTFLAARQKSYTAYDHPAAIQISPALFVGLFDDVFYRQLVGAKSVLAPSANFLILAGVLWAMARFRRLSADPVFLGISCGTAITLGMVFGVVPGDVITRTPFLGNVINIHYTFSVVAIVQLIVLAGFGVKACCARYGRRQWTLDLAFTIVILAVMLVLYFDYAQPAPRSPFFVKYSVALLIAFVALPILGRRLAQRRATPELLVLLLAGFIVLHWRHGMYLKTEFDDQVMNPQVRVNLQPESPAIQFVRRDSEPVRVVGFDDNLVAGYNGALAIESICGPDALVNPFYRELWKLLPIEWGWDWRLIVRTKTLKQLKPIYDLLNVEHYLALPDQVRNEVAGLTFEGGFDLDVYRSDTAWPRAFFTNQLVTYTSARQFVDMALSATGPFAAVQDTDLGQQPSLKALIPLRPPHVVPATRYELTNNTTTFTVTAPERGIVVLTEAYSEGDFSVTLNKKPATLIRVNHAFKGVAVDAPGTYTVTFAYWPQHFAWSLLVSAAGLLWLSVWWFVSGAGRRRKGAAFVV